MSEQGGTQESPTMKEYQRQGNSRKQQRPRSHHKEKRKNRRELCAGIQVKKMYKVGSEQLCPLMDLISGESTTWCGVRFFGTIYDK